VRPSSLLRRLRRDPLALNALAIGLATGAYGLSFGALATAAGLGVLQAMALSALVFTGATQLTVVGVVAAGGGALSQLANGLVLALRHVAYGVAVAPLLDRRLPRRLLETQVILDETTAMATAQPTPALARRAFLLTGAATFVCWNLATVAGAYLSRVLASPHTLGLDAVFPAAFVALLAPQLRRPGTPAAALAGAAIAAALVPFVPAGLPVLLAALGLLAVRGRHRPAGGDA
jgi:predicted branched-subunit amino acid permease